MILVRLSLEAEFTQAEIWKVVKGQAQDKAPGPGGFTGRFYTPCWPINKADLMEAFSALWRLEAFSASLPLS